MWAYEADVHSTCRPVGVVIEVKAWNVVASTSLDLQMGEHVSSTGRVHVGRYGEPSLTPQLLVLRDCVGLGHGELRGWPSSSVLAPELETRRRFARLLGHGVFV